MSLDEFAQALERAGYSPAVAVERPAGYSLDEHQHGFDAWALITAGDITLVVDGQPSNYAAGQMFRLPAGTPHHEKAGPSGVTYLSGRKEVAAP